MALPYILSGTATNAIKRVKDIEPADSLKTRFQKAGRAHTSRIV